MFVCFLSVQPTLLYKGYKEHTKNVEVTIEGYMEAQKADLDFYDTTHSSMAMLHLPASSDYAYFLCDLWHFCEGVGSLVLISWDWSTGQWWAYCCPCLIVVDFWESVWHTECGVQRLII